jgi:ketosteroid isomerase-like protein
MSVWKTMHVFEHTEEGLAETSRFFASGEASLDLQQSHVSGELAVLVAVERQHGRVGGLADQDWSLRVTLVFRRAGDRWQIVHRHADPLGTADSIRALCRARPRARPGRVNVSVDGCHPQA